MDALDHLADRLDTLPLAVRRALVGLVNTFAQELLERNRDYLQKQGERPDGQAISPKGYSSAYAAHKKKYGKFTNTRFVDLKFSGDFLASFQLGYLGNLRFELTATDKKAGFLAKYGELLGVREPDVIAFLEQRIKPELTAVITAHMNA
jgi:hypothetical protein